jgi:hypothetical protein
MFEIFKGKFAQGGVDAQWLWGDGSNKHVLSLLEGFVQSCPNVEGKAAGMNERKRKGKSEKEWKRGQFRKYDPLDFSLFTASENAAGGIFQQTPGGENP